MLLVKHTDPILRETCKPFDFSNPPMDSVQLAKDMVHFMYEVNGIGLAANQVGLPYRVFAMRGHPENFVCFNPKIVHFGDTVVQLEEGCVTYPGMIVKVKRPQSIRVRYHMANGDVRTDTFTGMSARIFQHELDHLDGIMFYERANRYHRELAMKKWKRNEVLVSSSG
jgi:peptide deformylase